MASQRDLLRTRFFAALFRGKVFDDPATLTTMLAPAAGVASSYRMGIDHREVAGREAYLHTGFWGVVALYVPDLDTAVVGMVTQGQSGGFWKLATAAVELAAGDGD